MLDLRDNLTDTVLIETVTGYNDEGRPEYEAPVPSSARVEYRRSITRNREGVEVTSDILIISSLPVKTDDRITLPNGELRSVISAGECKDTDGDVDHYEARA